MENEKKTDALELKWVPTLEGVLKYCPDDLRQDKPLRFWRVMRLKNGKKVIFQKKPSLRLSTSVKQRYILVIRFKGKKISFYRSHLTMLCMMGFAISDRHHWVIDHINNDSADDRPSNLQVIKQRDNLRRSALVKENQNLSIKEKARRKRIRQLWLDDMRSHLIKAFGDSFSKEDIEIELALLYREYKFEY